MALIILLIRRRIMIHKITIRSTRISRKIIIIITIIITDRIRFHIMRIRTLRLL